MTARKKKETKKAKASAKKEDVKSGSRGVTDEQKEAGAREVKIKDRSARDTAPGEQEQATDAAGESGRGGEASAETEAEEAAKKIREEAHRIRQESDARVQQHNNRISMLEKLVKEKEQGLLDYIKAHKKAQLEFEKAKNRLSKERDQVIVQKTGEVIAAFFEVKDNLERSVESSRKARDFDALFEGIEMITRQFKKQFDKVGVEQVSPAEQEFDPELHEAMGVIPVPQKALNNKVIEVLEPGYRYGDYILRPARVLVGKHS